MTIIKKITKVLACGVGATLLVAPLAANAKTDYPSKPVTVYVGFAAGGPTDIVARMLADGLTQKLGQTFVIENRPGASGELAANLLMKAPADGYTLMIGAYGTLSVLPEVRKSVQYKTLEDFTPIAPVARFPYYLTVSADSPFQTYKELIEAGRTSSNGLSFGSAGPGSANHLAGAWFAKATEINALHIPYKGDSAVLNDLIANRVDFAFLAGNVVIPQVQANKLRILASGSSTKDVGLKDVPVLADELIPGYTAAPWNGLLGPKGLPTDIVEKLNAAVNEVMSEESLVARLEPMDQYQFKGSASDFADHIKAQSEITAKVIRESNLTID